ncbi:FHA domain-containing protein [Gimesia panareensis]|uniref:FHA domain-containing protein n=1 Tax=Gimesia panareensis TaxID=2527978 RepID=UPI00118C42B4|nr:FHA domain-containing protein [Gimesia panareensis]QDU52929.1 hypothetical protein Pan110_53110 [Gimesia panareensis]
MFDFFECKKAQGLLEQGEPIQAAQLLTSLNSRKKNQKCVAELLPSVRDELCKYAEQSRVQGNLKLAYELMEWAVKCAPLNGKQAEFQQELIWYQKRIEDANKLVNDGRLQTAKELLTGLSEQPDANRLISNIQAIENRLERYIKSCEGYLSSGKFRSARQQIDLARSIRSDHPEVLRLEDELNRAASDLGNIETSKSDLTESTTRCIDDRWTTFVINNTLITCGAVFTIGTPRGNSGSIHLQLMSGYLHGLHALIVRDRGTYQIVPWNRKGEPCDAYVDGELVTQPTELHHAQILGLGTRELKNRPEPALNWSFQIPFKETSSNSATAVLLPLDSTIHSYDRIVLLDDFITIRREEASHIFVRDLPCKEIILRWSSSQDDDCTTNLVAEVNGGEIAYVENGHFYTERYRDNISTEKNHFGTQFLDWRTHMPVLFPSCLMIRGNQFESFARQLLEGDGLASNQSYLSITRAS